MKTTMKSLSPKVRKEVQSILRGNGLSGRDVILYTNGTKIVAEIKRTGNLVTIITE